MLIEERLKVSVWIAERMAESVFQDYIVTEDLESDGPRNAFARDVGELYVYPDYQDGKFSKTALSVRKLLKPLAYSSTFADAATVSAKDQGIDTANAVVAIYRHKFRGRWPKRSPMMFLGCFDYFPVGRGTDVKPSARKDYRYLEYIDMAEGVLKCWAIELSGTKYVIRAGAIGYRGKEWTREFPNIEKARAEFEKVIKAKQKAGYVVRPGAAPPKKRGKCK